MAARTVRAGARRLAMAAMVFVATAAGADTVGFRTFLDFRISQLDGTVLKRLGDPAEPFVMGNVPYYEETFNPFTLTRTAPGAASSRTEAKVKADANARSLGVELRVEETLNAWDPTDESQAPTLLKNLRTDAEVRVQVFDRARVDVPGAVRGEEVEVVFSEARLLGSLSTPLVGIGAASVSMTLTLTPEGGVSPPGPIPPFEVALNFDETGKPVSLWHDFAAVRLFNGATYRWELDLRAAAGLSTAYVDEDGDATSADSSVKFIDTAYWGGIREVRDLNGNPYSSFAVTSELGWDWAATRRSTVPEPAGLALLALAALGAAVGTRRAALRSSAPGTRTTAAP